MLINVIFHYNEKAGTFWIGVGLFHMPIKYTEKQKKGNSFYSLSLCSCPSTTEQWISEAHILTSTNLQPDNQAEKCIVIW